MTAQEAQALYDVLLRLVDNGQVLTPAERRDILNQIIQARCEQTLDDILAGTANARKLRLKRGTTAENDAYTGLAGEVTVDTDENTLRIHDGSTPGGHAAGGVAVAPAPTLAGMGLPSTDSINISIPSSGYIYTATGNGWLQATCIESTGTWVRLNNQTRGLSSFAGWNGVADGVNANMFVCAGDKVLIQFKGSYSFKFIPVQEAV